MRTQPPQKIHAHRRMRIIFWSLAFTILTALFLMNEMAMQAHADFSPRRAPAIRFQITPVSTPARHGVPQHIAQNGPEDSVMAMSTVFFEHYQEMKSVMPE